MRCARDIPTSTRRTVKRWTAPHRLPADCDGISLALSVTEHVRRSGKHFLPERLLTQLGGVRHRHTTGRPFLDAFLDCLLDKHEGRFWNRTYLALPVLELLMDAGHPELGADRMATLLMSDVVRFEIETAGGSREGPGRGRPDPATLSTRLRHALRFVTKGLGHPQEGEAGELPSRTARTPQSRLEDLVDSLPRPPATEAGRWFDVTVQPVYVLHDEYFFIRVLQIHEVLFTAMAADMKQAIAALRGGCPRTAAHRIDHAVSLFEDAAALFRTVATMRADQFHGFRQYTEGASAIQSEQYKRFESLCGVPTAPRLCSSAFTSVPAVRAEVEDDGHDTVARARLGLRDGGGFAQAERDHLDAALGRLESKHQRWKSAHRSLAARMLGDAHGSGYTDGVPYLTECLDNRLFWQLGATG
ncbi:tryptophan 2,3-dioxygenase family protein [Streptomyces sp. NBC_00249]|uniref:tryptophan 2,3-dioxygenase family protein n=1 Tax=Streptomyces sp. NBC_00249 TaxID=2975690 RepID=UPI00224FFADD|nr:tryptophan 2,3-dioxygenase family protein [Streptomyces sp. NBC_00249]MCX5192440.1 tryptophan 2,3-dioxygenase family protein [Streptomyces sp. NBC_00249]